MGMLFRPERGLRLGPRAPCRAASDLWQRPIPGLALRLRVDPEDLRPLGPPLLLDEVMIYGSAFLRPVQGLHVRGHARPRGVAVRAASCCSAPAHQMRSRVEPAFYGPRRADESSTCSRHRQASRRRTHGSRRRQGSFAQQRQGATSRLRRRSRLRCSRRCLRSSGEAFRCFRLRDLLRCKLLDVLGRGSTSEGRPMICGAGTSSGGGASPGGRLGILRVLPSQSPPPRRASIVWFSVTLLVAAAAPAAAPAMTVSAA